jgi:oligopeptide transport system ATP-binding protein
VLRKVNFSVEPGETVGVVGESGSGKSTLVRAILRLTDIDDGELLLNGWEYSRLKGSALRPLRERAQMVFQNPFGSLDDRWTIERIIAEPLCIRRELATSERRALVHEHLALVGLDPELFAGRFPEQLSGGQRQRVAIARAIVVGPQLVVLDEAVAALDVVTQGDVVNLLNRLQAEKDISYIFISHDIAVVSNVADRVVVIFDGQIVEEGSRDVVIGNPTHPYTRELLRSVPGQDPVVGSPVAATRIPVRPEQGGTSGCSYSRRCPMAIDQCLSDAPDTREVQLGHLVRCHLASERPPEVTL